MEGSKIREKGQQIQRLLLCYPRERGNFFHLSLSNAAEALMVFNCICATNFRGTDPSKLGPAQDAWEKELDPAQVPSAHPQIFYPYFRQIGFAIAGYWNTAIPYQIGIVLDTEDMNLCIVDNKCNSYKI